uniref:Uncharacterized protein AlNc14C1G107 n=1 Tax=Albugo laibachii Nc14 TaxID=890382 RepID=F0VYV6_9STRA|nr:conserved hypothetical protein [Albugo laibachii Nc14]|eukprot:CCA13971.1 conserved hypothetical protein [Albugo laibachii Nc14]
MEEFGINPLNNNDTDTGGSFHEAADHDMYGTLSPAERSQIYHVFRGETYLPMMFARTEKERKQQALMKNTRIAHQLRSDFCSESFEKKRSGCWKTLCNSIALREQFGQLTRAQVYKMQETLMLSQDNKVCRLIGDLSDRLYCGGFSSDGSQFLVAGQRDDISLYNTSNWELECSLPVHEIRWTVTDAKYAPDDKHVLYSTITSNIRMISVENSTEKVFSLHEADSSSNRSRQTERYRRFHQGRFGVWSFDLNSTGTQLVAGTSTNGIVLYDMEAERPLCHVEGHTDDVNGIAFVDGQFHSNVIVSGSDDALIKLWDRRLLSDASTKPQGVFPGHTDGITHLCSRDDGYYFLSNSKDQTSKLWDLRQSHTAEVHNQSPPFRKPYYWDYRYENYPGRNNVPISHPLDQSLMTYRGHSVMQTLIRCYFSPQWTTAQKYIYTGSADGRIYVWTLAVYSNTTATGDMQKQAKESFHVQSVYRKMKDLEKKRREDDETKEEFLQALMEENLELLRQKADSFKLDQWMFEDNQG